MARRRSKTPKKVETLTREEASRTNIPTVEYQSVMRQEQQNPVQLAYEHCNRNLDPQPNLFADFNGLADEEATAEFYQHGANLATCFHRLVYSREVLR